MYNINLFISYQNSIKESAKLPNYVMDWRLHMLYILYAQLHFNRILENDIDHVILFDDIKINLNLTNVYDDIPWGNYVYLLQAPLKRVGYKDLK